MLFQRQVKGINDYHLPEYLNDLYTSNDQLGKQNAKIYNNGIAMGSLTAQGGLTSRVHGEKNVGYIDSKWTAL